MDKDLLIERIDLLCKERKIRPTTAYIESGVGKNFKSNLSVANPTLGKITLLAEYFGVAREYLLGETDKKEKPTGAGELSGKKKQIIERIKLMPDEKLVRVEQILDIVESTNS